MPFHFQHLLTIAPRCTHSIRFDGCVGCHLSSPTWQQWRTSCRSQTNGRRSSTAAPDRLPSSPTGEDPGSPRHSSRLISTAAIRQCTFIGELCKECCGTVAESLDRAFVTPVIRTQLRQWPCALTLLLMFEPHSNCSC